MSLNPKQGRAENAVVAVSVASHIKPCQLYLPTDNYIVLCIFWFSGYYKIPFDITYLLKKQFCVGNNTLYHKSSQYWTNIRKIMIWTNTFKKIDIKNLGHKKVNPRSCHQLISADKMCSSSDHHPFLADSIVLLFFHFLY